jgi:hypothetical protein
MAVERVAGNATDPSTDGVLVAWHEAGAPGVLTGSGRDRRLAGTHPALGGDRVAVLRDGRIDVRHVRGPAFAASVDAPGADAIAVSADWVAWRVREGVRDVVYATPLAGGDRRRVMRAAELGRPSLEGSLAAFHVAGRAGGRIVIADLAGGRPRTIRRERRAQLLNPSLRDGRLLYVRSVYQGQELRIGPASRSGVRRDEILWSTVPTGRRDKGREPGADHRRHGHPRKLWPRPPRGLAATLWTTALSADHAYVTRLLQQAGSDPVAEILRVPR